MTPSLVNSNGKALVHVWRLGRLRYQAALNLQLTLAQRLKDKSNPNLSNSNSNSNSKPCQCHTLLLLEHHPVYTTGIRTHEYSAQEETRLRSIGADFHRADRGGLITFHGPGQLVAYPILNLKSFVPEKASRKALLGMKWYVHQLEEAVISTCDFLGLPGAHRSAHTGVWLRGGDKGEQEKKVCAMGVHNSGFITTHGLAINCSIDLNWFSHIVPCGIEGKGVTSLSEALGRTVSTEETETHLIRGFKDALGCDVIDKPPEGAEDMLKFALSEETDSQNCVFNNIRTP